VAIDRDENGQPRLVNFESISAFALLSGDFIDGMPGRVELIQGMVECLYDPSQLLTAVGGRCQPLRYSQFEGELCGYQQTATVWPVLNANAAGSLYDQGLYPLFQDLGIERTVGGLSRAGMVEFFPAFRAPGGPVCYRPFEFGAGEARFSMAFSAGDVSESDQAGFTAGAGLALLEKQALHPQGYPPLKPGGWRDQLCRTALDMARDVPPAAAGVAEVPIHIDVR
jgi:hypothetical protein